MLLKFEPETLTPFFSDFRKTPFENCFNNIDRTAEVLRYREEINEITKSIQKLEYDNQMAAFEYSKKFYAWDKMREEQELPLKKHNQALNELKSNIMSNVLHNVTCARRHINNIQKAVLEVEFDKALESVGGLEITHEMTEKERSDRLSVQYRIRKSLEVIKPTSDVKKEIEIMSKAAGKSIASLKSHLPNKKGKYNKSGQFTKERRAAKMKTARPYIKTGRHINDYQSPRFPQQRDKQIVERSKSLGVSQEEFRLAVMGK